MASRIPDPNADLRAIQLPLSWKRRLHHLRVLCNTQGAPQLDADLLGRVQTDLGRLIGQTEPVTLGEPILAILATGGSLLHEYEVRLAMLPRHTRNAHEAGLSRGLVGIGRTADGEILLAASLLGTRFFRFEVATGHTEVLHGESWLDALIQEQQERLRDADDEARARSAIPIDAAEVEAYAPSVLRAATLGSVHHNKFGAGDVLRELGDGKVEVRFASGTKTLLRSFLRTV